MRSARRWLQPTETDECLAFVDWTKIVRYKGAPLFERLLKIPNERGKRGVMTAILVALGMKPGFPDYQLLIPIAPHAGLFLEAKRAAGGVVSGQQHAWRRALVGWGYHAEICAGADELIAAVRRYMRRADPRDWYDNLPLTRGDDVR